MTATAPALAPAINATEEALRKNPNAHPRYVTPKQWAAASKLEIGEKVYTRKGKKVERHRITGLIPQFTGVTGTDIQMIEVDGKEIEAIFCIPRLHLEKFKIESEKIPDPNRKNATMDKTVRVPLQQFYMDALDFLEQFELLAED